MIDAPHPVVGGIGFCEAPAASRLQIRGHEGEARRVRNVLKSRTAKQVRVICAGNRVGCRPARHEAAKDCPDIDADARKAKKRPRNLVGEVDRVASGVELKAMPCDRQHAGGDRPSRDARNFLKQGQEAQFVKPDQGADMIDHGAVAAAGKTKTNAVLQLAGLQEISFLRIRGKEALDIACARRAHAFGLLLTEESAMSANTNANELSSAAIAMRAGNPSFLSSAPSHAIWPRSILLGIGDD